MIGNNFKLSRVSPTAFLFPRTGHSFILFGCISKIYSRIVRNVERENIFASSAEFVVRLWISQGDAYLPALQWNMALHHLQCIGDVVRPDSRKALPFFSKNIVTDELRTPAYRRFVAVRIFPRSALSFRRRPQLTPPAPCPRHHDCLCKIRYSNHATGSRKTVARKLLPGYYFVRVTSEWKKFSTGRCFRLKHSSS